MAMQYSQDEKPEAALLERIIEELKAMQSLFEHIERDVKSIQKSVDQIERYSSSHR